ncbi:MAG TPA: ABC transporter ATP-binding protein [Candidatus Lustribacter sp.]|nr:ABC transporter ATP-binding protein [Candidatus Lustribacter sp.]
MSEPRRPTGPVALDARDVRRGYRDVLAVDGVDIRVESGEILALVGLNGAGKTTLMRLLLAMVRPDSGSVRVLGREARACTAEQWSRVGHLIEAPFAYPELTVTENVVVAARLHGLSAPAAAQAAEHVLARLALGSLATRRSRTLSLGNRQRLGLACAMAHDPDVLVLDEPTNALDPRGVLVVRAALRDAAQRGAAVLVSSHHLDEVARVADRIAVMHRGRIIGALDPAGHDLERAFFDMIYAAEPEEVDA